MKAFRYTALVALIVLLAGCGFQPLYGDHGALTGKNVTAQLDSVAIENIPNREGQYLRNRLIDRLYQSGRPAAPLYSLKVSPVAERITGFDITKSADATRAQLRLDISMTLTDTASGKVVLNRKLSAITSYNILQSQFTTRVSEENARQNALDDLARQIELQLGLYFKSAAP